MLDRSPGRGLSSTVGTKREITVHEIRDFFCCPYMWWFRNEPLKLEERERLQKLKQEPGWARSRTMPLEKTKTGSFWLFSIAFAVAAAVAWLLARWFGGSNVDMLLYTLRFIGTVFLGFSIYYIVRWLRWRRRTPFYDRQLPGEVLFWQEHEPELATVHATDYGIAGELNIVIQRTRDIITMEYRSVVTPEGLTEPDRMQAVARALLAEAEFGERPAQAYIVYPDRTFEVPLSTGEVRRLLDAVFTMHRAEEVGHLPALARPEHLCPTCPIAVCKEGSR